MPAKKSATPDKKKSPAKAKPKAAKKPAAPATPPPAGSFLASIITPGTRRYSFDILSEDNDDLVANVADSLSDMKDRQKNRPSGFKSMADIRRAMIPVRDFSVQYALGNFGIPQETLMEIIGPEGIGKSTLAYWLMGGAMLQGIPCSIQETENKPLQREWAVRALHTDRRIAEKMFDRIEIFEHVFELNQMDRNFQDWVNIMRGRIPRPGIRPVPLDTPLLHVVDTWSKLMSPGEAQGFYNFGDNLKGDDGKAKKLKSTNESSNLEHSKWAQAWCRRLPSFLAANNVILVLIQHKNTKVDMTGTASKFSGEAGELYNKTKIGGNAFNQNAALQIILQRIGLVKDGSGSKIGMHVKARVDKNSYGPSGRLFEYYVINEHTQDTESYISPSVAFAEPMAKWFADDHIIATQADRKRYSSKELGVQNATAEDFCAAFHANVGVMNRVGKALKIHGFADVVDEIKKETPPEPETPAEEVPPAPEDETPPPPEEVSEEPVSEEFVSAGGDSDP